MNEIELHTRGQENSLLFIVEDSLTYRVLLSRLLEKKGFKVMSFEKPEEAIRMLRLYTPAVFISDIEMPDMNGFEMYEAICTKYPSLSIPFMYISATESDEYITRASEIGAIDMIGKPFSSDLLFNSLNRVLNVHAA